jgi:hypothetical protein
MMERLRRAMNYWMFAVSRPGMVLETAQRDMHRIRISFYIIFLFSMLLAFSSWMLWTSGRLPFFDPWIPFISGPEQYFYQTFMIGPWIVLVWLVSAGFVYLFTSLVGKEAFYEDSLMISALSLSIPYLMFWWIPDTFLLPAMGAGSALKWPDLFELERIFLFPGIWQMALVAFGMRKVNNTNRIACVLAGLMSVVSFVVLYFPFIR